MQLVLTPKYCQSVAYGYCESQLQKVTCATAIQWVVGNPFLLSGCPPLLTLLLVWKGSIVTHNGSVTLMGLYTCTVPPMLSLVG